MLSAELPVSWRLKRPALVIRSFAFRLYRRTMFKIRVTDIVRRFIRLGWLLFHAIILADLAYDIICSLQEEISRELFNSIQCGLTAVVSFLSYAFYLWYYKSIQVTLSKLRKTDGAMKSMGIREDADSTASAPIQLIVGAISIGFYAYSKYLRNLYLAAGFSMGLILKNVLVRTYFVATNGFVMLTFINNVHYGRRKFQMLNHHVECLVETNKKRFNVQDVDDVNNVYLQVVQYCDSIRNSYQIQIFLTSISDMFTVIYMLLTVFNEFVSRPVTFASIVFCIIDPLYRIVQTVVVISAAVATTKQARQMADCLQRLMIETLLDTSIKEKLRLFLMEMVDKKLTFIVSGFLTLNYETLVAMMGTISTYLLIMMQFRPPGDMESDDNNSLLRGNRLLY